MQNNGGMHAKKGIIRGKNKLDKGKNEAINDITAINPEHMPMKAIFSLVVSFCLKIFMFALLYFTLKRF